MAESYISTCMKKCIIKFQKNKQKVHVDNICGNCNCSMMQSYIKCHQWEMKKLMM